MHIYEAIRLAVEAGKPIYRKTWMRENRCGNVIVPTNGPDCCLAKLLKDGKEVSSRRCWNPKAEDLISDDWELFD